MPNSENDSSDNSEKILAHRMINGPIMHIRISGPVGIGKTILATRIERLLKEEFNADCVVVSAEIRQEQNAMNMADWRTSMADRMAKTIYTIDEETVVQVRLDNAAQS